MERPTRGRTVVAVIVSLLVFPSCYLDKPNQTQQPNAAPSRSSVSAEKYLDVPPTAGVAPGVRAWVCLDGSQSYGKHNFDRARDLVAREFEHLLRVGRSRSVVYVRAITSNTIPEGPPPFIVPGLAPPPVSQTAPALQAGAEIGNRYSEERQAFEEAKATAAKRVTEAADGIRAMRYPRDKKGTDIHGCFQALHDTFRGDTQDVFVVLASDMVPAKVAQQYTDYRLDGARVNVVYFRCGTGAACDRRKSVWKAKLERERGALEVTFHRPEELVTLFGRSGQ